MIDTKYLKHVKNLYRLVSGLINGEIGELVILFKIWVKDIMFQLTQGQVWMQCS